MKPGSPKLTVISPDVEAPPAVPDMFSEERMVYDLARFARSPGVLQKYVERLRSRFTKAGEKAILEHWIAFYERGRRLIEARTEMERRRSEYLQLSNEHELRAKEKEANIAEHNLRRDIAEYKRQHIERFVDGGSARLSESEQKLNEAYERRKLDARWELYESIATKLNTLTELQHWRKEERQRILADRSLSPKEQTEALEFLDDLYEQKRSEIKADTRIFEEQ